MTARRGRKQITGVRNKLDPATAEALAGDDTGTEWGPAMKALPSDRHRAFVLSLYQIKTRLWGVCESCQARRLRLVDKLGEIVEHHCGQACPR